MAIDWSDEIVLAQLTDEPSLSEELATLIERLGEAGVGAGVAAGQPRPDADPPHVVLDFSGVTYINSSNIAQLLRISKNLGESGRALRLCGLSDEVWSVMMITGLDKIFRFAPDTLTALASIQIEEPDAAPGSRSSGDGATES
ncbi:MAG: STAS domain-containing protein [Planctomycetota bacterium]